MRRFDWMAAVVAAAMAVGCGGSGREDAQRLGPDGGQVQASGLTLTVPAGALQTEVEIEVELVRVAGAVQAVELRPADLQLSLPVTVTFHPEDRAAGALGVVEVRHEHHAGEVEVEHGIEVEVEHQVQTEHGIEFQIRHLGHFELRHRGGDDQGLRVEPGDDNGVHPEPGDDNGVHPEPGDDRGAQAEPGDDNGRV
jgi:hypothetical protein